MIASGRPWSAGQTLALYWRTASDPDAGASIEDTLAAAGAAAVSEGPVWALASRREVSRRTAYREHPLLLATAPVSLILGVTLPEPHAVAVTPDGTWWSWGEPFNPEDWPDLVIDEAWAVLL